MIRTLLHEYSTEETFISSKSETFASELLEHMRGMFSRFYMHSNRLSMFKYSTTQHCATCHELFKETITV